MSKVDELKTSQYGITNQMSGLQDQVNQANLLAEQRNTNAKLMELIAGKQATEPVQLLWSEKVSS
jgi:hypothetical protein